MKLLRYLFAALCVIAAPARADGPGTVTSHAFAIGKGPYVGGYASLLCAAGKIPMGQSAADPSCVSITGDAAISAAGVLTLGTVNASPGTFGSATQSNTITVNGKGLVTSVSSQTATPAVANITGLGTGVSSALSTAIGSAGAPVLFNGAGGTPSSLTLTNATGLPRAGGGTGTATGAVVRVNVQTFCATGCTTTIAGGSSGTYTPLTGLLYATIECQGGGGGGGSVTGTTSNFTSGSGGGGGAYARKLASAATIGVSQTVTMGAAGVAAAAGDHGGGNGGQTSVGTICVASGGTGGPFAHSGVSVNGGGAGGSTGTGDIVRPGGAGGAGYGGPGTSGVVGFGWGGVAVSGGGAGTTVNANGLSAAANSGAGGSGGMDATGTTNFTGGAGGSGIVTITEYLNQ